MGGIATSAQRVARSVARLGHTVLVLTFDSNQPRCAPDYVIEEQDGDVIVRRVGPFLLCADTEPVTEDHRAECRDRACKTMMRLAREFWPDIVISFCVANAGLVGAHVARRLERPHLACVRGEDIGRNIFSLAWFPVLQFIFGDTDGIVCVNKHLRDRLTLAFPEAGTRATVISNGVELPPGMGAEPKERCYLAEHTSWSTSDVVVVFIGEAREKKGIKVLLEAVEKAARIAPVRLLVVGPELSESERGRCGALWDRLLALGVLHVTGFIERKRALGIASEGHLIAMPSLEDGLANGLLEGMALGLCPIVSAIFSDVVRDGECGWIARQVTSADFAPLLVRAAEQTEVRRRFGIAAKRRVETFYSSAAEASSYVQVFEGLLRRSSNTELTQPSRRILS